MVIPLIHVRGQRRGAPQQIELAPPRFHEMTAQVGVRGIPDERFARLVDRLVDDLEVVLDDGDRRRVEPPAAGLQGLLEVGDGRVVLRVGEADGFDADVGPSALAALKGCATSCGRCRTRVGRRALDAWRRSAAPSGLPDRAGRSCHTRPPDTAATTIAAAASCGRVNDDAARGAAGERRDVAPAARPGRRSRCLARVNAFGDAGPEVGLRRARRRLRPPAPARRRASDRSSTAVQCAHSRRCDSTARCSSAGSSPSR